jgi:AraC-like DNA-binding protein
VTKPEIFRRAIDRRDIEIRSDGTVWRLTSRGSPIEPRRIDTVDYKGYYRVTLGVPGGSRTVSMTVHRLQFFRRGIEIPAGMQVNHIDYDKSNNRWENLELVSQSENMQHSLAHGRPHPYSYAKTWRGRPRIDLRQQIEMRRMRDAGATLKEVAEQFGCSISHAHRLTRREVGE